MEYRRTFTLGGWFLSSVSRHPQSGKFSMSSGDIIMKQTVTLAIVFCLVIAQMGCGGATENQNAVGANAESEPAAAVQPVVGTRGGDSAFSFYLLLGLAGVQIIAGLTVAIRFDQYSDRFRFMETVRSRIQKLFKVEVKKKPGKDRLKVSGVLTRRPEHDEFLDSNDVWYQMKIRHDDDIYLVDGTPQNTSLAHVHVPLDVVTRLGYRDLWEEGTRLLDTNRFCVTDKHVDKVDFIARGKRWRFDYHKDKLKAGKEHDIANCEVALHWYVHLPVSEDEKLNRLFDRLHILLGLLRDRVLGLLQKEFTSYDHVIDVMYSVPEIIEKLNSHWEKDEIYEEFRGLVTIVFTGLVIKPRIESEVEFVSNLLRGMATIETRKAERKRAVRGQIANIADRWTSTVQDLEGAVKELNETVPESLKAEAAQIAKVVVESGQPQDAIDQSARMYQNSKGRLAECCDRIENQFEDMTKLIRYVQNVNRELLQGESNLSEIWKSVAGEEFSSGTRFVRLHRGELEIEVISSGLLDRIREARISLLDELERRYPNILIHDIVFSLSPDGAARPVAERQHE